MGTTKTQWWDKEGGVHDGYIRDGQTFIDEEGKARVPIGATVQTNGGTYKMTALEGVPTMATAKNQYAANSNAAINAYQAAGKAQEERVRTATDAAIAEINRQKELARTNREEADKAARDAYRKAANPFGALEEQRVRMGLDESGYAESSKLRIASDYAAQQVANLRAQNEQLQALDVQIEQAKAQGQYELANMLEARAQNVMQQKLALEGNLYSGDMQAISQAENVRQFDEQMAAQREAAERQNKYNLALMFLENGESAPWIAELLGIPEADVNALVSAVNARKTVGRSTTTGGQPKAKISSAYDDVVKELWGVTDADIVDDTLSKYIAAKAITDDEAQAIRQTILGGAPRQNANKDVQVRNTIAGMERRGKATRDNIINYINGLTAEEISTELLDELIDKYNL